MCELSPARGARAAAPLRCRRWTQPNATSDRRSRAEGAATAPPRADVLPGRTVARDLRSRSEEHTSELQSLTNLVCRLLLEKKKKKDAQGRIDRLILGQAGQ